MCRLLLNVPLMQSRETASAVHCAAPADRLETSTGLKQALHLQRLRRRSTVHNPCLTNMLRTKVYGAWPTFSRQQRSMNPSCCTAHTIGGFKPITWASGAVIRFNEQAVDCGTAATAGRGILPLMRRSPRALMPSALHPTQLPRAKDAQQQLPPTAAQMTARMQIAARLRTCSR